MSRRTLTDAWVATVRVSIPIDATAESLTAAQAAVAGIRLPGGAHIEIIAQRFGRMAVQASNSGADVDGTHEATKQSEDAPESDTAAPQGGGGNCGTTIESQAKARDEATPMTGQMDFGNKGESPTSESIAVERVSRLAAGRTVAETEVEGGDSRERPALIPADTGTLTFPSIPAAFDRRVPRVG